MVDPAWFAGKLRELRERSGMTQQELATKAGMHKLGVAKLERGERNPAWETVLALAEALGVDCTAFTEPPAEEQKSARGRPPKQKEEPEKEKKPRGRPKGSGKKKGKGKE